MGLLVTSLALLLAGLLPASAPAQSIQRVSVATDGTQGTGEGGAAAVSADGRFVAFESTSPNLVPVDGNLNSDVFFRDTCVGAPAGCAPSTTLVSLQPPNDTQFFAASQPAISADGRFVVFTSAPFPQQVWRRDTCVGAPLRCIPSTTLVSVGVTGGTGNGDSRKAAISADGRFVAFLSFATNLLPAGVDSNSLGDIYVRDLTAGTTERVSLADDGSQAMPGPGPIEEVSAPQISADGRFVAFASDSPNLVPTDTNSARDLFVRDRTLGRTARVSVASNGAQSSVSVSAGANDAFSISGDGRFVAFRSTDAALVAGDTNGVGDVFVRDTCAGAGAGCVPSTARVSLTSTGGQILVNGSFTPSLSATGRFVAFVTAAATVVPGDTNNVNDVFVRDTCVGGPVGCAPSTVRASVAAGGVQANNSSGGIPKITADGRFVAFVSFASNLVANDGNGLNDTFLAPVPAPPAPPNQPPTAAVGPDQTVTEGALVTLDGTASSDPNGQLLAFTWTQTGGPAVTLGGATTATSSFVAPELGGGTPVVLTFQLVVSDGAASSPPVTMQVTVTDTVRLVRPLTGGLGGAPPDGVALNPSVSADGRFVAFESSSTNLVVSGCTNGVTHVFLRDRVTGTLVCLSVAPNGAPGNGASTRPAISADGRVVVFQSAARNLVAGGCGTLVVHIYVRDLVTKTTTCVSVATGGAPADADSGAPALSGDGALIVFISRATNLGGCPGGLAQLYLRDRGAGTTTCLTLGFNALQGDGPSDAPVISADGRVIAFTSAAGNLVAGCGVAIQILVLDRPSGTLACASVDAAGTAGSADSRAPALNADGTVLAFASLAHLAAPCSNGLFQIFVRHLLLGTTQCITVGPDGSPGNGPSTDPAISADGLTVVFLSQATNLTAPAVLAAALGAPVPQLAGPASTVRWQDSAAVQDPMTILIQGAASGTGDKTTGMSGDASVVVTEVPGGGAGGGPGLAAIEEVPAPPVGQPLIVAPAPGTAFTLLGAIPLTFTWTPVQNAAGYRLAFSGAASVSLDVGPAPTFTVTLTAGIAPPGAYQLQVTPLGAGGAPGTPSAPLGFSLIPGVTPQATDRPFFTTPDAEITVTRGQLVTFAWTALAGAPSYGFEFTGTDRVFANPNGAAADGVNGFGGAGGGFLVQGPSVTVQVPSVAPGRYQVRVIGFSASGQIVGSFSDAVTVVVQ